MNGIRLSSDSLDVLIVPERGGKLASILDRRSGFELLYQPRDGYPPLRHGMPFAEGDASGFDDVFPSMEEFWLNPEDKVRRNLPDHGEIWTAGMAVDRVDGDPVKTGEGMYSFVYLVREEEV